MQSGYQANSMAASRSKHRGAKVLETLGGLLEDGASSAPGRWASMAGNATKHYSADELKTMRAKGDYVPTAPEAPEIELDEVFWQSARLVMPAPRKEAISLRVDQDILDWFRAEGRGYQSRMNAVLRAYVESRREQARRGA